MSRACSGIAGSVECCEPTSRRSTASPPPRGDGTVPRARLAGIVPVSAVGASDAIPMCLLRMGWRCSGTRSPCQPHQALHSPHLRPRSVCKPEMSRVVEADVSACTTTGLQHSHCTALMFARPSAAAAKVEPWREAIRQTQHSTYHPTLRWTRAPAFAPRARGLALWSTARETRRTLEL